MPRKGSQGKPVITRRTKTYKKHYFRGNQSTIETDTSFVSTSTKKLQNSKEFDVSVDRSSFYVVMLFSIFSKLSEHLKCKICDGDVLFEQTDVRGLGFQLKVTCDCVNYIKYNSCEKIKNAYSINRRLVFVMRFLGVGLAGLEMFVLSFSQSGYKASLEMIKTASNSVAEIVLKKAGAEERALTKEKSKDGKDDELTVSGDGTWAKRGYSSLVGVSSVIGKYSGKILDVFVSSKTCHLCTSNKKSMSPQEFNLWFESEHQEKCKANYEGSSGGMEVQGIIKIFQNSIKLHGARYSHYIGDGDSKTFTNLLDAFPYGKDFIITKLECVLHVGKRLFRHLKDLKKTLTEKNKIQKEENKKKEEEKKKQEKSKKKTVKPPPAKKRKVEKKTNLTGKVMKKLSLYYGLAIQRNKDSKEDMKNEIWAAYYHMISTDSAPQHHKCNEAWCGYLKAQNEGGVYKHNPPISEDIQPLLKEVYEKLTDDELLERCLGGNTQNNNECYNKTLWALAPKHTFSGKDIIDIATNISLSVFNEGQMSVLKIMEVLGIKTGTCAHEYSRRRDEKRIKRAEKQTAASSKESRIKRKEDQQNEEIEFEEAEGLLYGPGLAD